MDKFLLDCCNEALPLPDDDAIFPARVALAMSYVPTQRFENLYDDEKGFTAGTIFASLDKPFVGGKK